MVNHRTLVKVVDINFGIRGVAREWIITYLLNIYFVLVSMKATQRQGTDIVFRIGQHYVGGRTKYSKHSWICR